MSELHGENHSQKQIEVSILDEKDSVIASALSYGGKFRITGGENTASTYSNQVSRLKMKAPKGDDVAFDCYIRDKHEHEGLVN